MDVSHHHREKVTHRAAVTMKGYRVEDLRWMKGVCFEKAFSCLAIDYIFGRIVNVEGIYLGITHHHPPSSSRHDMIT